MGADDSRRTRSEAGRRKHFGAWAASGTKAHAGCAKSIGYARRPILGTVVLRFHPYQLLNVLPILREFTAEIEVSDSDLPVCTVPIRLSA
jgi:hypothetical protein